jgi:hypothetical protein
MKGSSDFSSSSKLTWVLVQAKTLYWNADGTTNLPEWKMDILHQAAKGAYGIYSVCLVKLKVKSEWIDEFIMPTEREWDRFIDPEQRLFDIKLAQYEGVRQGWVHSTPSMSSFLLLNITESSEIRVLEQSSANWGKAKIDNDIIKMFILLCDSHNFYGKQASLVEQRAIRFKHDTFIWISPEDLQHFKLRWDKLIKELTRVGIDVVMLPRQIVSYSL